ncbi:hypothetical protein FBUS_10601 [Fasciolopsis buskii]|uniref:C2H2-type domain-containing protein n=1 Tax=Fasciolopsis buskii TaxID=27845 RepID=A0A8E0RU03_9TREM|nr:hypothetical protein FBUS_10601 [Fasciolopsis buski]
MQFCANGTGSLIFFRFRPQLSCDGQSTSDVQDQPVNSLSKRWICNFCGEQFVSYFRLRGHMMCHKDRRVYACVFESCSQTFPSPEEFLGHVIEYHPVSDQSEINTCSTCGRQFCG